ncbi:MAG: efflux transporter outer membrane subunit [Desulfobacterium sp.]
MSNRIIVIALLMVLMTGCSMIPEYKRPALPVTDNWPTGSTYPTTDSHGKALNGKASDDIVSDIAWKDYFKSNILKTLIKRALENNRDLRVALFNIEKAKAAYRIQRADTFPVISGVGSVSRSGVPEDISGTGKSVTRSNLSANLAVTAYELDFFGRIGSLNQKALEAYLSTEEAALNTRIALIAETAESYLAYLAEKKLFLLAKNTLDAYEKTHDVVKLQYDVGSATQLDLAQATTSVESAKASIAQYTRLMAQAKNACTLLAGTFVDDLLDGKDTIDDLWFMETLPQELPSSILMVRPDIRQAEHQLKAANADIGAARAALYPSISLTSTFGLASDSLSALVKSGAAYAWNFAPLVSMPIFNREGLNASLEVARVNEKIAAAEYEAVIQVAFKEVADQLAARGTYKDQLAAQDALVTATRITYDLSSARYQNGIDNFLTVLDSQRSLFAAEQTAVTVKQAYLSNLVTMYKVLGGGQL